MNGLFYFSQMNLPLPQSVKARAELQELMHVPRLLVSAATNSNTMGVIQDALLGCYLMSARDCFLERDEFFNLIYAGLQDKWDGVVPVPAILKPRPLWTGKQLLSMTLPDISMNAYDTVCTNDEKICIRRGYICTGRFDKKVIGKNRERGLIHRMVNQEGCERAAEFISTVQFVANNWMEKHSYTVGIQDCCVADAVYDKTTKQISETISDCSNMRMPEEKATIKLNRIRDIAAKHVLDNLHPKNGIMNMIKAGSKGSNINIAQISAAVGQQTVNGKRIACGDMNRTTSHYSQFSPDPIGRGFVKNSYITGLSPKEFFTRKYSKELFLGTVLLTIFCFFTYTQTHRVEGSKCIFKIIVKRMILTTVLFVLFVCLFVH